MALTYDGVDATVDHGDVVNADGANLSFCLWQFLTSATADDEFLTKFVSASSGWEFNIGAAATTIEFIFGAATNISCTVANVVSTDVWQHWGVVYDGGGGTNADRLKIYKDGVALTVNFSAAVPATITANATVLRSGRVLAGRALTGRQGDIFMWNASLTAAEIAQQMHSRLPIRTTNLILWAPYDDGTSARDYSGTGNHGTGTGVVVGDGPPRSYGALVSP